MFFVLWARFFSFYFDLQRRLTKLYKRYSLLIKRNMRKLYTCKNLFTSLMLNKVLFIVVLREE